MKNEGARLMPMPGALVWQQLDIALYGVGRSGNPTLICEGFKRQALGKSGAVFTHSAKLLIPQGDWRSINSDGDPRRDSLSL
jgi:hypothetical protein